MHTNAIYFFKQLHDIFKDGVRKGMTELSAMCKRVGTMLASFNDRGVSAHLSKIKEMGLEKEYEIVRLFKAHSTGGNFHIQRCGEKVCKVMSDVGFDVKEPFVKRKAVSVPSVVKSKRYKTTNLEVSSAGGGCAGGSVSQVEYYEEEVEVEEEEPEDELHEDCHYYKAYESRFQDLVGKIEAAESKSYELKTGTEKFVECLKIASGLSYGPIVGNGSARYNNLKHYVSVEFPEAEGALRAKATMEGDKMRILNAFRTKLCERKSKVVGKGKGKAKAKAKVVERGIWYIDVSKLTPARRTLWESIVKFYVESKYEGWVMRKTLCPVDGREQQQPWKGSFSHLVSKHGRQSTEEEINSHSGVGVWVRNDRAGPDAWVLVSR